MIIDVTLDGNTHPYLVRLSHCYQPHTRVPSRQELLDEQCDDTIYQTTGHCTLTGLALQAGFDSNDYIKQVRAAERIMARVLDDTTS